MTDPDVSTLLALLERWRHLPAYQLERRADIFFGLFLPDALDHHLRPRGLTIDRRVIPEFPLGHAASRRSAKADYFALSSDRSRAFLIELKTDMRSVRPAQERYLKEAVRQGMSVLLPRLIAGANAAKPYARRKYFHLLWLLDELRLIALPPDLTNKIYGNSRGVHQCIDDIAIASPLPALELIHVLPKANDTTDCIDFETFAGIVQCRGDIGKELARHLRRWACVEAGTARPGEGQAE